MKIVFAPRGSALVLAALTALGWMLPGIPGALALYPVLGIVPGLALAEALPLARGVIPRWALALAAGPLASTAAAWALMAVGLPLPSAARAVALGGWAAWGLAAWTVGRRRDDAPPPEGARFAVRFAVIAGAVIAGVMLMNPWIRVRGDAWIHGGIAWQIMNRGVPPEDPRFAGLQLQYVWFYDFFVALLCALRGGDAFVFMSLTNAAAMVSTLLVAWMLGFRLWGTEGAARGALLLAAFGFNAGVWILWPLRLLTVLVGADRGWVVFRQIFDEVHWHDSNVIFSLNAPFTFMVNFLDKFLHGTSLSYAYLLLSVFLWAWLEWIEQGAWRALFWVAAAACGMLLFHGVVGLSVIPVGLGALALAWLMGLRLEWLPSPRRLAALGAATLIGALAAAPYTVGISRGWAAEKSGLHHSYLEVNPYMVWTMISALAAALWLAHRPALQAFTARRAGVAMLLFFAVGMVAFTIVVSLPLLNNAKFIYQSFVPIAAIGGVALWSELEAWTRRLGRRGARVLFAIAFLGAPTITVAAYLADSDGRTAPQLHPTRAEAALHTWMEAETPKDAVFVDAKFRDLLMVLGRRQLWLGSESGPERAAFPLDQVLERRAVMRDLYGALSDPERDARALARLGRAAYVVVRAGDPFPGAPSATALGHHPDLFRRVYDRDGLTVYRVTWSMEPASPPTGDTRP